MTPFRPPQEQSAPSSPFVSTPPSPTISVCVRTYNEENTIEECLDSVLSQDIDVDYEVVVADDGSTDATRSILQRYEARYPDRIRLVFHDENQGHIRTFWSLQQRARGKFVAVLDGDDYWTDRRKLQKQLDRLRSDPPLRMVGCQYRSVFETQRSGPAGSPPQPERIQLDQFLHGVWIGASTVLYHRSVLENLPDWVYECAGDDKVLQFLCVREGPIGFINEAMVAYRVRNSGVFGSKESTAGIEWMIEYLLYFERELTGIHRKIVRYKLSNKYYMLAQKYAEVGKVKESRTAVGHARTYELPLTRRLREEGRHLIRRSPMIHSGLQWIKHSFSDDVTYPDDPAAK